jgi:predicted GNAT family N-acyltransferase
MKPPFPPPEFHVEPADYALDFKDLRAVREPVFVHEQKVPIELEWDELDPQSRHVIARDADHQPIGTGRLTPERKIGRMAVLREWRGKGVGEALLRRLIDEARSRGWPEVTLHAQVGAIGFYENFGFIAFGEEYEDAGIRHLDMRLMLVPEAAQTMPTLRRSEAPREIDGLEDVLKASSDLVAQARRELLIYTRDLERILYGQPLLLESAKRFAIAGHGGIVRIIVQEPGLAQKMGHPLLELAQRLPSVFQFRVPCDPEDFNYPSAFVVNDCSGYLFRSLGSRFEAEWSPNLPARCRQLQEHFSRVWERCRPCTEFRALAL